MKRISSDQQNKSACAANRKLASKRGMTMAEMLITVAIIIILSAVTFISLISLQRLLALKQRDGVAKEIFICAQNHLTMAKGEGYRGLDVDDPAVTGTPVTAGGDIYYFVVNAGNLLHNEGNGSTSILDLMLPFGSIDETVRKGDNYIICYQLRTGKVTDVFYCTANSSPDRFNHAFDAANEYKNYIRGNADEERAGTRNNSWRKTYSYGEDDAAVMGWCDGTGVETLGNTTKPPVIKVRNGDKLIVEITRNNEGRKIKLLITGKTSKTKMALDVPDNENEYVLDDVTVPDKHFAKLNGPTMPSNSKFIPGEDISIVAVAYSNSALCNVAYSGKAVTNSLFQSISKYPEPSTSTDKIAYVSSIRHLENLDPRISNVNTVTVQSKKVTVTSAIQTGNLVWADPDGGDSFVGNTGGRVCKFTDTSAGAVNYFPVRNAQVRSYEGKKYTVKGIVTSSSGDAGMFEQAPFDLVKDLKLIDFTVTSDGSAGALAGTSSCIDVRNVVAYNSVDDDGDALYSTHLISGSTAGGLIGTVTGGTQDHTMSYCGAAMKVSGTGNAGGLIGSAAGGTNKTVTIDRCFSGGHTVDGKYTGKNTTGEEHGEYNVTSNGVAGGLIGSSSVTISNSYSTCSASGNTAGGFIGLKTGGTVNNCYATGLVSGNGNNAFVGSGGSGITNSYFYEIVNETEDGYKGSGASSGVSAIDSPTDGAGGNTYENFVGGYDSWKQADPYDTFLTSHYGGRYSLKTVTQLSSGNNDSKMFVDRHYGDWPAPELFFINYN